VDVFLGHNVHVAELECYVSQYFTVIQHINLYLFCNITNENRSSSVLHSNFYYSEDVLVVRRSDIKKCILSGILFSLLSFPFPLFLFPFPLPFIHPSSFVAKRLSQTPLLFNWHFCVHSKAVDGFTYVIR